MTEPVFDEGSRDRRGPRGGLGRSAGFPVDDALAMVASSHQIAAMAEVSTLMYTVDWASEHGPDSEHQVALLDLLHDIPLAGVGAPLVREDAIAEFAATVHMSDAQARLWIGDALELAHRLPATYARLCEENLPVWKARAIATATRPLSPEGAAWMDTQLAYRFEKVGHTRLQRLITYALTRFDPLEAARRAEAAAEQRKVDVHVDAAALSQDGMVDVIARVDLPDGLDFDHAVAMVADEQKQAGSEESLDVRRAKAVGIIARRVLTGESPVVEVGAERASQPREVTLYVHLDADPAMQDWARVEGPDCLAPVARVKDWVTHAQRVTVRPVIDLNEDLVRSPYAPSATQREQAVLIHETCAHPWCTRRARRADLDHIDPYDTGPDGSGSPPGQTRSSNLAPLCRYHHRLKTFTDWVYTRLAPGTYLWRSPGGRLLLRTREGTTPISFAA